MKKLILGLAAATAVALVSCDESSRLASRIEGTWSGSPERIIDNEASTANIIETYEFVRNPGTNGGDVRLTALVSVTGQITGGEGIIQPFSLSAAGVAAISGSWQADGDDDINLAWNDSTLTVSVDPSAVTLSMDMLTGESTPTVDSLKPQLAESIRRQTRQALEYKFLGTRRISDIKIKDNRMKCEINDVDLWFDRQGPAQAR
ncbi:MAG: hypothetical protein NC336_07800 [Clostridium sp.]|nr:hypothetical protein [Clostridium sp.]